MNSKTLLLLAAAVCATANPLLALEADEANDVIARFVKLAPDNSEMLWIVRPQRLCASSVWKHVEAPTRKRILAMLPQRPEQIEFAAALTRNELFPSMPTGKPQPKQYAVLVRFSEPTNSEVLTSWLSTSELAWFGTNKAAAPTFSVEEWEGHEVRLSKDANVPAILRLDERSFVLVASDLLRKRLLGREQPTTSVDSWFAAWQRDELQGDLVVALALPKGSKPNRQAPGPLSEFEAAKSVVCRLDLSGPTMCDIAVQMHEARHAESFKQRIQGYLQLGALSLQGQLARHGVQNLSDDEKWLGQQATGLIQSIEIETADDSVTIQMPRPENFEQYLVRYRRAKEAREVRERQRFEAARQELDQAADAAAFEAQRLLLDD